jgi:t-SNARE complex subunit (syntaxin)
MHFVEDPVQSRARAPRRTALLIVMFVIIVVIVVVFEMR